MRSLTVGSCVALIALVALVGGYGAGGNASTATATPTTPAQSLESARVLTYPAPYTDRTTGKTFAGPVAATPSQLTSAIPSKRKIDAVVFIMYWSQLEPAPGHYRWDKVDQVISYWRARGKKVVLNPVTYAVPREFGKTWGGKVENGLPDWLLPKIQTLPAFNLPLLGAGSNSKGYPMRVPVPWDKTFRARYAQLIQKMGQRYNGNPGVEFVRIGTGKYGEDNYPRGCAGGVVPKQTCAAAERIGWTPKRWYDYSTWLSKVYRTSFSHTNLSISLTFAGIFLNPNTRNYQYHLEAQRLLDYARGHNIMLGTNGMRAESLNQIQAPNYKGNYIARILTEQSRMGQPVEFEQYHPINNPEMADTTAIGKALELMRPRYVNFFGSTLAQDDYLMGDHTSTSAVTSWKQLVNAMGSGAAATKRATAYHQLLERLW